jgi:LmbE family N-acetylglucosaminyl deacetylase
VANSRTLVCVHAHPDDEAIFTSGVSSHYASLGCDVVLVTCTNGRLGFDHEKRAGNDKSHDDDETRATRASELQHSAALVGFTRVVTLGFDDSGMVGWPQNQDHRAFMNVNVDAVARTLAALFDEVSAAVVITYDEKGFYGHPDHVMANVVTRRALEYATSPQRLYYPVTPRSVIRAFVPRARAANVFLPAWITEADAGTPDELVATAMDVSRYTGVKQQAIQAHRSQLDNADLTTMEPELFTLMFGTEYYQRAWSRGVTTGDATDLFGGL